MSDVPLHIKIMASLGIIKVTQKRSPPEKKGTLPKGFSNKPSSFSKPRRSFNPMSYISYIIPLGIIIPLIFAFLPVINDADTNAKVNEIQTLQGKAKVVADKEEKDNWEKEVEKYDNPEILPKLLNLKSEIDVASCEKLGQMLENERWTLRAYVAHTILEKSCSVGLTHQEIDKESKIHHDTRQKILYRLRDEGKIYFSVHMAKWKLLKYKSRFEYESMEWCAG